MHPYLLLLAQAATGTTTTWCMDHVEVTPPAPSAADGSSDPSAAAVTCMFPSKSWLIPDNGFYTINKQLQQSDFKVKHPPCLRLA